MALWAPLRSCSLCSVLPSHFIIFNYHFCCSDFQPIPLATSKSISSYLNTSYRSFKLRLVTKLLTKFVFPPVLKLFPYHSCLSYSSVSLPLLPSFYLIPCPYFKVPCYCSSLNSFHTGFPAVFHTEYPSNPHFLIPNPSAPLGRALPIPLCAKSQAEVSLVFQTESCSWTSPTISMNYTINYEAVLQRKRQAQSWL